MRREWEFEEAPQPGKKHPYSRSLKGHKWDKQKPQRWAAGRRWRVAHRLMDVLGRGSWLTGLFPEHQLLRHLMCRVAAIEEKLGGMQGRIDGHREARRDYLKGVGLLDKLLLTPKQIREKIRKV